ncbi:uncharacterized protein LOC108592577 [Callithrix jacchus]|uniref:uncharacterized protein LOC108592577 isoform X2 n=1 Tax=Callithrix jacchus TaxID=9483 RepID=UPI0023DD1D10|nr:uncharacterized protein LOC108592577 isoform X2 [Callithrix jacchus]
MQPNERYLGHEGSTLMNRLMPITKGLEALSSISFSPSLPRTLLSFQVQPWDDAARRPSPDASPLILDYPASKTHKTRLFTSTPSNRRSNLARARMTRVRALRQGVQCYGVSHGDDLRPLGLRPGRLSLRLRSPHPGEVIQVLRPQPEGLLGHTPTPPSPALTRGHRAPPSPGTAAGGGGGGGAARRPLFAVSHRAPKRTGQALTTAERETGRRWRPARRGAGRRRRQRRERRQPRGTPAGAHDATGCMGAAIVGTQRRAERAAATRSGACDQWVRGSRAE